MMLIIAALALVSEQPTAPADKPICRSVPVIGSNIARRECHTAQDWKKIDRANGIDPQDRTQRQQMQALDGYSSPH